VGILFGLPSFVYFALWVFVPIGYGIWESLTNDSLLGSPSFVGLANYTTAFSDPQFWHTVERTFEYGGVAVVPTLVIGLAIAILLNGVRTGQQVYLMGLFLPVVVPSISAALVWELILQPAGLLNATIGTNLSWLLDPSVSLIAVGMVTVWSAVGYYVVVFLAGLQNIPTDVIEAGAIDGARRLQTFWYLVAPLLRPTILFATVTSTAAVVTNFTLPFVLTNGGPGDATLTMPLLIYREAFSYSQAGFGQALAMILLVFAIVLTLIQFRLLGRSVQL
jgi:ABC-type sugar transport system permease subunit